MADVATVDTVEEKVNMIGGYPFRGRIPTPESLEKKISRIHKVLRRVQKMKDMLPDLEKKLSIITDPRFAIEREKAERDAIVHKADRAENLLASLPADVRAAIMAKLSGK